MYGLINVSLWFVSFIFMLQVQETNSLVNYGALGIMVLLCVGYIYFLQKTHKEERREWAERYDKQADAFTKQTETMVDAFNKNSDAIRDNSRIIAELKGIIESLDRRIK